MKIPQEKRIQLKCLCSRSKWGGRLSIIEQAFVEECYRKYPEDYAEISREVYCESMERLNPLYRRES